MAPALCADQAHAGLMTTPWEKPHGGIYSRFVRIQASYGVLSRFGLVGLAPSLEGIGVLARSPAAVAN
jgi:hypothetical protein